jgi:hypothetical protein
MNTESMLNFLMMITNYVTNWTTSPPFVELTEFTSELCAFGRRALQTNKQTNNVSSEVPVYQTTVVNAFYVFVIIHIKSAVAESFNEACLLSTWRRGICVYISNYVQI